MGCFPSKDMQTPPPPPVRSGHLDMKDAHCAETKDVLKKSYHIISRLGAWAPKRCVLAPKN